MIARKQCFTLFPFQPRHLCFQFVQYIHFLAPKCFNFCVNFNRCTKIINADSEDPKYIINVKQFAKFVVDLSDQVAPTDIEEGMRVG